MGAYQSSYSNEHVYRWKPDTNKLNDKYKKYTRNIISPNLKKVVDNEAHCGPVLNQGKLGSCTANAISGAYTYRYNLENDINSSSDDEFLPSRLFIYYNERSMEGTTSTDAGAEIKDGIKSVSTTGICPESMWTYDISKFTDKPSEECYEEAKKDHHVVKSHRVIKTLDSMKGCLETGRVFVLGFVVFESFEDPTKWNGNVMPIPEKNEIVLGGHAVLCVGFDDDKQCFKIRNSWGEEWGDKGNFYMPYKFMTGSFNLNDYKLGDTHWNKFHKEYNFISKPYCSDMWSIDVTVDADKE
jgi:C1A family cysteine protease